MKKTIVPQSQKPPQEPQHTWLDLNPLVEVAVSSEDPGFPVESALVSNDGPGWRAAEPGPQRICLHFSAPQSLSRVQLVFAENQIQRTQEFVLRWRPQGGEAFKEIVRQQYVFSPGSSTCEVEDYKIDLIEAEALELSIIPDITGTPAYASLSRLRVA